jgi:uncharacterized protein YjiS (DUF1127 family)
METIMSTILNTPHAARAIARPSWTRVLYARLRRRWLAYRARQVELAAIDQLQAMTDRELKDIGLTRSEIIPAVMNGIVRRKSVRRDR